jgi:hypothetical protein
MPQLKLVLVAVLLTTCTGCALRQSSSTYRLTEINSQYFLLSPDAAASQHDHQTLRISRKDENQKDCSVKGPWFSFYPAPGSKLQWIAETPSAAAWERSAGAIGMMDQWQSFESALYGLQKRQCFASLDEYLSAQQRIAASLSPPAGDTLYYRYAFGPGGYVDLAPGMQLRIERDFFGTRSTDYQGTTITNYQISGNAESGTSIKFLRVEKRSAGSTTPVPTSTDAGLTARFATAPRLRLFLLNLVVSDNAKSPAILIGASGKEELSGPTQAIESDPTVSCSSLLRWPVTCALFDGSVTVSPMLEVFVNGAPTYFPIGARLWSVLPQITNAQRATLMRTLRLQRRFQGRLVDVKFAPNSETLSQLLLFGGDRISWSKAVGAKM